jgi:uncharacterized protein
MVAAAAVTAQLLLVTEARGFVHHSIPAAVRSVEHLGYRTRLLSGADQLTAARLRGARAVVFLNTSGDLHLDTAGRRRLLGWIRDGGAFVGAHAAADTWPAWRGFHDMLGADFLGHGPPAVRRVRIVDARATSQRSFSIREEFYKFRGRPGRRVIARRPDGGALVWTRRYGRGRVFYDALGHFAATWRDPRQRRLMADGLRWATARPRAGGGPAA